MDTTLKLWLGVIGLVIQSGVGLYLIRFNLKWNVVLDRVDMLYKKYCDEHNIPFKGLKNDWE